MRRVRSNPRVLLNNEMQAGGLFARLSSIMTAQQL